MATSSSAASFRSQLRFKLKLSTLTPNLLTPWLYIVAHRVNLLKFLPELAVTNAAFKIALGRRPSLLFCTRAVSYRNS